MDTAGDGAEDPAGELNRQASQGMYFPGATHPTAQVDVMNGDGTALRKLTPEGSNPGNPDPGDG